MASYFDKCSTVTVSVPKPVIIFNDMTIQDWKERFIQLKEESTEFAEKQSYDKCLKTLMWGEFCNGKLSYLGNSKDKSGFTVKFTFQFTSFSCMVLFQKYRKHHLELVKMS